MPAVKKASAKTAKPAKYIIDCSVPSKDSILDIDAFDKYMHDRFKVNGRVQNLGTGVQISSKDHKIIVAINDVAFSKRYLKYLAKKFLKKNQLRDYLRVISTSKDTFTLRYYNIDSKDEEEEEE